MIPKNRTDSNPMTGNIACLQIRVHSLHDHLVCIRTVGDESLRGQRLIRNKASRLRRQLVSEDCGL